MAFDFAKAVEEELARARTKHAAIHSPHEGIAVVHEEFLELQQEVYKKHPDNRAMLNEAVQLGAMAQRMAEDAVLPRLNGPRD